MEPIRRGDLFWLAPDPIDSGIRHPHVVVQDDVFNDSRIDTVVVCAISSHPSRATEPGNVALDPGEGGLTRPSTVVVSRIASVPKAELTDRIGHLSSERVDQILDGLRFLQRSGFTR